MNARHYLRFVVSAVCAGCLVWGFASCGQGSAGTATTLTGKIQAPASASKHIRRARTAQEGYSIIAQSVQTGQSYRATSDADGNFQIAIPGTENGNTFMVTILGPDSRPMGPVIMAQNQDGVLTGIDLAGQGTVSLGTIPLPDDPTTEPITVGTDATIDGLVNQDTVVRVDENGVPVGVPSRGKGQEALLTGELADSEALAQDADRDGLVDLFDADDNGNGIVDDFEGDGDAGGMPEQTDVIVNCFMNLKISAQDASTYYEGSAEQIAEALRTDTVITWECMLQPSGTRTIASVRALESPAPPYLAQCTLLNGGGLWSESGYAFEQAEDRFQVFLIPNALLGAGDVFTLEITFEDGTTEQYCRMINYAFTNIPKLVRYGAPGNLTDFDVSDPNVNGTLEHPIPFDGSQDLVLVFNPPVDETGTYLTNLWYAFEIFYEDANGQQLNGSIDSQATWGEPIEGFTAEPCCRVAFLAENLELSAENTYTFTLPKEVFPDTVQTQSGPQAVASYKIDIAAQCPSGNAAIMLEFVKQ